MCARNSAALVHAIDTNVLVRVATRDDEAQARAAEACIAKGVWVSHVVLVETAWTLTSLYGASRASLAEAIRNLLTNSSIAIQDEDVVRSALTHFAANNKIAFADCLILEIARKAGHMPLATFDRDLARLDGAERV